MQSLTVLPQMFMQMLRIVYLPIFWIVSVGLLIQIGVNVWRREEKIWGQKQVVYWLPAFLFRVLEYYFSMLLTAVLGGLIASLLLVVLGVSIDLTAIPYLWIVMLFLCCLNRRFVCFAYAGGILVLLQNGLGLFQFDAKQLMMMVAVLHFTEAILVYINGASQSYPVYLRSWQGKTICRTQLQMLWPIPMVMPVPIGDMQSSLLQYDCMIMPEWWPLFHNAMPNIDTIILYSLAPMLAVIGYNESTEYGKEQAYTEGAAILLLVYSILLGSMVLASQTFPVFLWISALFAILGHEAIVRIRHSSKLFGVQHKMRK